jgi:hypothetical protein
MTAQRREMIGARRGLALIALLCGVAAPAVSLAAAAERVVVNRFSGLAIGGYDPVAYFTDARPKRGQPNLELMQAGAVWRFDNEGNRAFFFAHPEIYGPQFGGYDPVDVARGIAYAGNPQYWLIQDDRLYLFGRAESRDAFAAAPGPYLTDAKKRWSDVQSTMAQ